MGPRKLASPSKHSSKRKVKYKGESRMNHDPYDDINEDTTCENN
jgi:hypothetical protein